MNFPDTQWTEPKSLLTARKQTREPTPELPQNMAREYRLFLALKIFRAGTLCKICPDGIPVFEPKIFSRKLAENFHSQRPKSKAEGIENLEAECQGVGPPKPRGPQGVCPTGLAPGSRVENEPGGGTARPAGPIGPFPKRTA